MHLLSYSSAGLKSEIGHQAAVPPEALREEPFTSPRKESIPCFLCPLKNAYIPWLMATFSHHLDPYFHHHISIFDSALLSPS